MKIIAPILILVSVLFAGCASIPEKVWSPIVEPPFQYAGYQAQEGPFVAVPLYIGGIVGSPLMLVTTPLGFLCDEEGGAEAQIGHDMEFMLLGPVLVGDVVATPFLAVKKTFWDFPRWVFGNENTEKPSNQSSEPTSDNAGDPVNTQSEAAPL